jgi:hypothetical protein
MVPILHDDTTCGNGYNWHKFKFSLTTLAIRRVPGNCNSDPLPQDYATYRPTSHLKGEFMITCEGLRPSPHRNEEPNQVWSPITFYDTLPSPLVPFNDKPRGEYRFTLTPMGDRHLTLGSYMRAQHRLKPLHEGVVVHFMTQLLDAVERLTSYHALIITLDNIMLLRSAPQSQQQPVLVTFLSCSLCLSVCIGTFAH